MIKLFSFLSIILFSIGFCFGQDLTKQEKKELLEEIKMMKKDPIQLKYLKESVEIKDVIIDQQTTEIINLKKEVQQQKLALKSIQDSLDVIKSVDEEEDCAWVTDGFHYRVQIGLFRDFDITQYLNDPKFIVYEKVGDLYRYSIGNFDKLSTAEFFAEEMKKMGLQGAFVSEYLDGERINTNQEASETTPKTVNKSKNTLNDPYFPED